MEYNTSQTSTINAFKAYNMYLALKLHFSTDSYDYLKYHGKTNATMESFLKRKDRYFFFRLAKKYPEEKDLEGFLVANLSKNNKLWIGDLLNKDDADFSFKEYQRIHQSLSYHFSENIKKLMEIAATRGIKLDDTLKVTDQVHPILLALVINGDISMETLIVLDGLFGFLPYWNQKLSNDIEWPDIYQRCIKYKPFLNYDLHRFKELLKSLLVLVEET